MSDALPSTWLRLELGNVVAYGSTEKAEPESISPDTWVLELEDIEKDTSRIIQKLTFAERQSKSTKNRFENGDVLYGKLRPYLNKVVQADRAGVCTTEIIPIKANAAVNGRFLFHWFRHPEFLTYVTEVSHGVNMPRLGTEAGRAAPFVLAPLPEQKRIADKLDSVLARVDACRDRLDRLPALLKRFRQSILAAGTSGRLTEDWRPNTPYKAEFRQIKLGEAAFVTKLAGFEYTKHVKYRVGGDLKVLKAENVGRDGFRYTNFSTVFSNEVSVLTRSKISEGDLLMVFVGAGTGQIAMTPHGENWFLGPNIALIRPNPELATPKYIEYYCRSPQGWAEMMKFQKSTAQPSLSMTSIRLIQVMLPSLEEQTEIVRRVELLFAFADRLEARLATARLQVGQLTPTLLAKAFRGELVPQDPADEPAAELLKRLSAQREAAPKARRGRASKA